MSPHIQQLIEQSIQYFQNGSLQQAEELLLKVLHIESKNLPALEILGLIKASQGQHAETAKLLTMAIRLNPNNPATQHNLAKALWESKDYTQSIIHHEKALQLAPANLDGWLNYGQALLCLNRYEAAISAFDKALSMNAQSLDAWHGKALSYSSLGQHESALDCYANTLRLNPDDAKIWLNASVCFGMLARYQEAIGCCDRSLALQPNYPEAWLNKGSAFNELKEFDKAIDCYNQALGLNQNYADAWYSKGVALQELQQYETAIDAFDSAITINAQYAQAHCNKGLALQSLKQYDEAIKSYDNAIAIKPDYVEAFSSKGVALQGNKQYDESLIAFDRAIAINPNHAETYSNKGKVVQELNLLQDALSLYRKSLEINPNFPGAHHNLAQLSLQTFNFKLGWDEYQWRWLGSKIDPPTRLYQKPIWDGNLTKNRLLVLGEQGIGDQILYSSVFRELGRLGKKIIASMDKKLIPIYTRSFPEFDFIERNSIISEELFDEQIAIGDLMKFFRPNIESLSNSFFPYIKSSAERDDELSQIIRNSGAKTKIICGLSWRGANKIGADDKSIPIADLLPIIGSDKFHFYNLQPGDIGADLHVLNLNNKDINQLNDIDLFDDLDSVVSLINVCDLVITSSNTTAHIAGALNKKTILILPFTCGKFWYWHDIDGRSAWYPSIMTFTQTRQGSWVEVIQQVKQYMETLSLER